MDDMSNYHNLFIKTASEHINELGVLLLKAKATQLSNEVLSQMHLHAHSLKSEAQAMGYKQFGAYVTVMEKYLKEALNDNRVVSTDKINILSSVVDEIRIFLQTVTDRKEDPPITSDKILLLAKQLDSPSEL